MKNIDDTKLRRVFDKANGRCHLCLEPIALANYGAHGARGAWEIDHSVPVSQGGTDHLNNLYPAHTSCNRSKQARSSRSVREANGRTRPPLSAAAMEREKSSNALVGAITVGFLGLRIAGPFGFWVGLIAGGLGAYAIDPEGS